MRRQALLAAVLSAAILVPSAAFGHAERPVPSPPRPGKVPDLNRAHSVTIDVCKTGECPFEHIQAAIDSLPAGNTTPTLIRIWPGFYKEEPSRLVPNGTPDNANGTFSYEYMLAKPNAENLVAIVGKKNITLRGMGQKPGDVVVDAEFKKHVTIRGDRSDGLVIENLSTWHGFDHGIYILDTDGFVIDHVVSGYAREYPFLTFGNDHGLMQYCEAFGGGDGGIYPGSSADIKGARVSTEIRYCTSHHNVLGYSGTQGDDVWFHHNELYDNAVGFVTDSETDHPNYPQNDLLFENNKVHDNNFNVHSTESDVRATVFANSILMPVGLGVWIASGNNNVVRNNEIWGNDWRGVWFISGPGVVLGPIGPAFDGSPFAPPFINEGNRFIGNKMYNPAKPEGSQNGTDFGWDGLGLTNCWQNNVRSPDGEAATSNALFLPPCDNPVDGSDLAVTPGIPDPTDMATQASLIFIDSDGDGANDRPICDLTGTCPTPWDVGPPEGKARNFPDGYKPPPTPPTCGPSTCPASSSTKVLGTKTSRTFAGKASALPATGVGSPLGLGIALIAGAAAVGVSLLRRRFPR
jgi:parallel beta helix pectate lyase-like protein